MKANISILSHFPFSSALLLSPVSVTVPCTTLLRLFPGMCSVKHVQITVVMMPLHSVSIFQAEFSICPCSLNFESEEPQHHFSLKATFPTRRSFGTRARAAARCRASLWMLQSMKGSSLQCSHPPPGSSLVCWAATAAPAQMDSGRACKEQPGFVLRGRQ